MIIGSKTAQTGPAEHQCKRGDHAKHCKRTPKGDAPGQAAPFDDEIGFK
jgi:hypothetical protein